METTSFMALARRFFGNQVRTSRKEGKTMEKLLKGLMALTVMMGITTSAYAGTNDWITVFRTRIESVNNQDNGTALNLKDDGTAGGPFNNTCGGMTVWIPISHPLHDRAFVLFNTALLTDVRFEMLVEYCEGTKAVPYKIYMK